MTSTLFASRSWRSRLLLLLPVAVAAACATAPAARADCPASSTQGPALTTTAPTFYDSTACGVVEGDHQAGRYRIHNCGTLAPTVVTARDAFDVAGVPAGTEVSVIVRFRVEGWAYTGGCGASGCCGYCRVAVRAGTDSATTSLIGHTFSGRADFSGEVDLPVVLTAGTPLELEVELYGRRCPGGAHSVDATGQVVFQGSDPNVIVVSCKGFGPAAVPVAHRSWGRLKTIHR